MNERGDRNFGDGDGELGGRAAILIKRAGDRESSRDVVRDGLRSWRPEPRREWGDIGALLLLLAFALGLVWLLWPTGTP